MASATSGIRRNVGLTERSVAGMQRTFNHGIRPSALIAAGRSFDSAASRANLLRGSVFALTAAFGGLGAALTSNVVARYFDSFTGISNQLRVVTKDSADLALQIQAVNDVANRSRSSLGAVATLYSRIAKAAPGEGSIKTLRRVETINKALQLGGATAQEAASAAIQFSQAIASNRLGGEELRAVLETPLGLELARGLGVTIGKFREMSIQGQLTADVLFKALDKISGSIDQKFASSVKTIDQALTQADNKITVYAGHLNETYGITKLITAGIDGFADNLERIIPLLALVGAGLGTIFAARGVGKLGGVLERPFRAASGIVGERRSNVRAATENVNFARAEAERRADLAARAKGQLQLNNSGLAKKSLVSAYARDLDAVQRADAKHLALIQQKAAISEKLSNIYKTTSVSEVKAANDLAQQTIKVNDLQAKRVQLVQENTKAQTSLNGALGLQATNTAKITAVAAAQRDYTRVQKEQEANIKSIAAEEEKLGNIRQAQIKAQGASFAAAAQARAKILVEDKRLADEINASQEKRGKLVGQLGVSKDAINTDGMKAARAAADDAGAASLRAAGALRSAERSLLSANKAAGILSSGFAILRTGMGSLVGFLGGPWGVAFAAGITALTIWAEKSRSAAEEEAKFLDILKERVALELQRSGGKPPETPEAKQTQANAEIGQALARQKELQDQLETTQNGVKNVRAELDAWAEDFGGVFGQQWKEAGNGLDVFIQKYNEFRDGKISFKDLLSETENLSRLHPSDAFEGLLEILKALEPTMRQSSVALESLAKDIADTEAEIQKLRDKESGRNNSANASAQFVLAGAGVARWDIIRRRREQLGLYGAGDTTQLEENSKGELVQKQNSNLKTQINDTIRTEIELREKTRKIGEDQVLQSELLAKEQELLTSRVAKTREEAERLAREFFALDGKVVDLEFRLNVTSELNKLPFDVLRGLPPGLRAFEDLKPEELAERLKLTPLDPLRGFSGALPKQLNTDIVQRGGYGIGRDAAELEFKRQKQINDMLEKARDTGDKALNTPAKIAARGNELLTETVKDTGKALFNTRAEAEAFAKKELDLAESQRLAAKAAAEQGKETKNAGKEMEKFRAMIAELQEQGRGAFLSDLDRDVLERAKTLKYGADEMQRYIDAINSGDLSKAPQELLQIRDALQQIGAAETWRDIIGKYGQGAQLAGAFAEKQAQLNMLVSTGRITAAQAGEAWADFVGGFKDYQWVDKVADAFGEFANSAITDFKSIEDSFKGLLKSLMNIITQEVLVTPFKNWIRSVLGGTVGGGATGGGGTGGILGGVTNFLFGGGGTGGGAGAAAPTAGNLAQSAYMNAASMVGSAGGYTQARAMGSFAPAGVTKGGIALAKISTSNGLTAAVDARYADRFQTFLNKLEGSGYKINSLGEGGYSYRTVKGSTNLSKHAYGQALDINPRQNPWSNTFQTDLPPGVNKMAQESGLFWGGNWNKPDTMHFQVDKNIQSLQNLDKATIDTTSGLGNVAKAAVDMTQTNSVTPSAVAPSTPSLTGGATAPGGVPLPTTGSGTGLIGGLFSGLTNILSSLLGGLGNILTSVFSGLGGLFGGGGGMGGGGGLLGGLFSFLFHEGGTVGSTGAGRMVPAGVFAGAPRLHSGFMRSNEFPAILEQGEEVLRKSVARKAANVMGGLAEKASSGRTGGPDVLQVQVNGANGDKQIAQMVNQGVTVALAKYDYTKKQGGAAADDHRYRRLKRDS